MSELKRTDKEKARPLTYQEHFLRIMKKHKRQLPIHTVILAAVTGLFLLASTFITLADVPAFERDDDKRFTARFVGDVMFGRHVQDAIDQKGYDHLFAFTDPYFAASDFATGNFAQPVVPEDSTLQEDENQNQHLKAEPESLDVLAERNFQVMNIANNNIHDYGYVGMISTRDLFDNHPDIDATGIQTTPGDYEHIRYTYSEEADLTIATIGFSDVIAPQSGVGAQPGVATFDTLAYVMRAIVEASTEADMVVVHTHWGEYYNSQVTTRQREIAEAMAKAGADVIIGHNPNVPAPVEIIDETIVFYSLGNFIFDQGWSRSKQSTIAYYELDDDGMATVSLQLFTLRDAQPRPVNRMSFARLQMENMYTKFLEDDQWTKDEDGVITIALDHSRILKEGD